ncbi:hypothetical protein ACFXPS_29810 [Nocardia sp. NPDC059091]|uniref:hypothetical protein n=1 Tax=unclassified Nocardia TaxID=2637762 RepID=UPI0036C417EE
MYSLLRVAMSVRCVTLDRRTSKRHPAVLLLISFAAGDRGISDMRSFEEQYADLTAKAKRVNARTPRVEILLIRQQIKIVDHRVRRTDMPPERRERLNRDSWTAFKELELRRYALEHPLITGPERDSGPDRDLRRDR